MIIMRKAMDRRTILRGAGAVLALPLLDAMATSASAAEAAAVARKRFQVIYMPNGLAMRNFTPAQVGEGYALTPILEPLAAYRDKFMVISGVDAHQGDALGDGAGDHARACGTWLTGVHVKKTEGADITCGVSMDQLVANKYGEATQLPSLELGLEPPSLVGSCDSGYSCAYTDTLSWRDASTPLPVTTNPRDVFEALFGDGDSLDPKARMAQLKRQASVLDFVADDAKRLSRNVGSADQKKIDEYLQSVRDIERRIQKVENSKAVALPDYVKPSGIPDTFDEHARMMIDLQVLANQADLTRVGTLMLGREASGRSYPEISVPDGHHPTSHHGGDPEKYARLTKINIFHMEQVAYYLKRMTETKDGDATLLDNTILVAGPSMADPDHHDHTNLTTIVGGGLVKGNRHLVADKGTPMTNVLLSSMDILGVHQDKLGDSTGRFAGLTA
jgi:hypothetical protein